MEKTTNHFAGRVGRASTFSGPVSFMNPTTRYLTVEKDASTPSTAQKPAVSGSETPQASTAASDQGPYHVWRSRDNRKGRHAVAVSQEYYDQNRATGLRATNTLRESLRGIGKMFVRYPVWDVSYDVAMIFTIGSAIWIINGFFVWYSLQNPASAFPGESKMGGGVTAFIGATIFELGSVLMMLEAVNENRADCFGWALEDAVESGLPLLHPSHEGCRHSHNEKRSWLRGKRHKTAETDSKGNDSSAGKDERSWSWWPSSNELRTHYVKEIGFWACTFQMIGATVFWIAGFTGLPPIFNALSIPASNGIYWLPQVIGGSGFIISGALFMLETQSKWYIPAPKVLGWHVGFWNMIGGIGFTLCGALGFAINANGIEYASTLSTFIGAWAFMVGSVVQWYESLDKYPISAENGVFSVSK